MTPSSDLTGTYPLIQGFSVENLFEDRPLILPPIVFRKKGKLESDFFSGDLK